MHVWKLTNSQILGVQTRKILENWIASGYLSDWLGNKGGPASKTTTLPQLAVVGVDTSKSGVGTGKMHIQWSQLPHKAYRADHSCASCSIPTRSDAQSVRWPRQCASGSWIHLTTSIFSVQVLSMHSFSCACCEIHCMSLCIFCVLVLTWFALQWSNARVECVMWPSTEIIISWHWWCVVLDKSSPALQVVLCIHPFCRRAVLCLARTSTSWMSVFYLNVSEVRNDCVSRWTHSMIYSRLQ